MARDTNVAITQEDNIPQVSDEVEGRVSKRLSLEFSWTEKPFLGTLSRLAEFLLNPLFQGISRSAPDTYLDTYGENHGTNEDCSQSGPHPEARVSQSQFAQFFDPDKAYDSKKTGLFQAV